MSVLIYLHGFLSSPESKKAQVLAGWLKKNRPDISYICPQLSSYPKQAKITLLELMAKHQNSQPMLMGSSLGGFWATWLAEEFDCRAVLINPAVKPSILLPEYLGIELKNYYTDETYTLNKADIAFLLEMDVKKIDRKENYYLMAQTGDEALDYRLAVEKYQGCKQLIESDGNHSFENFESHIPDAISFLENVVITNYKND